MITLQKFILAAITLLSVASLSFGQTGAEDFNRSMLPIPDQPFTGKLEKVTINITDHPLTDEELRRYRDGRAKAALAQ